MSCEKSDSEKIDCHNSTIAVLPDPISLREGLASDPNKKMPTYIKPQTHS